MNIAHGPKSYGPHEMEYSHSDEVPAHLQQNVVAAAKPERGQDVAEEA